MRGVSPLSLPLLGVRLLLFTDLSPTAVSTAYPDYGLFKLKNILDPEVRKKKWAKMRPIAPNTKHPMKALFHKAGRALCFISKHIPGEHFVIDSTLQVPGFLQQAEDKLAQKNGKLHISMQDIEGCYPNMPKEIITQAVQDTCRKLQDKYDCEGVWVPRRGTKKPCEWMVTKRAEQMYTWIPFIDLIQIMQFSLDHAVIKMPNGKLLRQNTGIPMGDNLSPGETVIACAWMENEYMSSIAEEDKKHFLAGRYMDDVILVTKNETKWDNKHFEKELTKYCYVPPLSLEPSKEGVFLETEFEIQDNHITHRLKNDNKDAFKPQIWRYQHFNSYAPYIRKRAVITAALKKVQFHASDKQQCVLSGIDKVREFMVAGYPDSVIKYCTNVMASQHDYWAWKEVYKPAPARA